MLAIHCVRNQVARQSAPPDLPYATFRFCAPTTATTTAIATTITSVYASSSIPVDTGITVLNLAVVPLGAVVLQAARGHPSMHFPSHHHHLARRGPAYLVVE